MANAVQIHLLICPAERRPCESRGKELLSDEEPSASTAQSNGAAHAELDSLGHDHEERQPDS